MMDAERENLIVGQLEHRFTVKNKITQPEIHPETLKEILFVREESGGWPTWLAPVQVYIIVTRLKDEDYEIPEERMDFVLDIKNSLEKRGLRVEIDYSFGMNTKLRNATLSEAPHILVVDREAVQSRKVRHKSYQKVLEDRVDVEKFLSDISLEVLYRRDRTRVKDLS